MFPSAFETSVYTVQPTICPSDIMVNNPPDYQYPSTVVQDSFDSLNFAEGSSFLPVQDFNVATYDNAFNPQPHLKEGEFNMKANDSRYLAPTRKQTQNEQPVQVTDPEISQQQLAAKRRRKNEASYFCTVPGCSADFTSKHRLESHLKGYHLGIKDNICSECSYATAHPSDLLRHVRLKHTCQDTTPDQR